MLDLVAGNVAGDHERHEREPGRERRHQDRREPLRRAAQDELRGRSVSPSVSLEVLEVVDHQDPVARGDPEHGVEADERAEREDAAAEPRCERPSDQRHRQREERQRRPGGSCLNDAWSRRKIAIAAPIP